MPARAALLPLWLRLCGIFAAERSRRQQQQMPRREGAQQARGRLRARESCFKARYGSRFDDKNYGFDRSSRTATSLSTCYNRYCRPPAEVTAEVKPRVAALKQIVPGRGGKIRRGVVTGLCGAARGVERSCLCIDGPIMWVCCTSRFSIAE
jgi:hypothetical protein